MVATSLIRTRRAVVSAANRIDEKKGASNSSTITPSPSRPSHAELEDNQALQEADQWILAVCVVIDNSLSNYFQFEVGDGGGQYLIACVHVTGPHESAKTDHLCLLIEGDLSLGFDHQDAVGQHAHYLSADRRIQSRIGYALSLRGKSTGGVLRKKVLHTIARGELRE